MHNTHVVWAQPLSCNMHHSGREQSIAAQKHITGKSYTRAIAWLSILRKAHTNEMVANIVTTRQIHTVEI